MQDQGEGDFDGAERRAEARLAAKLRTAKLTADRGEHFCRVVNLSPRGMTAEAEGDWSPGEAVTVELKPGEIAEGRIAWADGGRIGIAFDDEIDPGQSLAGEADGAGRCGAPARVSLCIGGGVFCRAVVVDIALDRIEVELDAPDCAGRAVVVTLEGLSSLDGIVRWQRDGRAGIDFDQPLSLDAFAFWLGRAS